jgi:hypothetical protein
VLGDERVDDIDSEDIILGQLVVSTRVAWAVDEHGKSCCEKPDDEDGEVYLPMSFDMCFEFCSECLFGGRLIKARARDEAFFLDRSAFAHIVGEMGDPYPAFPDALHDADGGKSHSELRERTLGHYF